MNRTKRCLRKRCALFVCLVALAASLAFAQNTGSLRGQVTDPSGAAVPNASVTVTGPANTVKVATADNSGNYVIVGLPGGAYTIRASAPGFTLFEKMNFDLTQGRGSTLDIPLTVEVSKEQVTVTDTQKIEIDPEKNASAIVLKGEDLDFLSDDPDDLQADLLALAGPSVGPNGGQIYIDGFSNGQLPPKENIREIRINSNPFSSEYDQPGFGRIEIFTKPGTDKFRGNVLINYGDSIFNSRNPFSGTADRPGYSQKQFQANLTGPLTKKSSFNIEVDHRNQNEVSLIQAKVLDPSFLSLSPSQILSPSFTGTALNSWYPTPQERWSVSPRVDYQLSTNITLSARYTWSHTDSPANGVGGFNLPSRKTTNIGDQNTFQLTETQVIGARAVNESRFQYHRTGTDTTGDATLPVINVSGAFTTGGAGAFSTFNHTSNYEFQNNTSLTRNKHFIKFGVRIRGAEQTSFSPSNYNGSYTFAGFSCSSVTAASNPFCAANPGGLVTGLQAYALTQMGLADGMSMQQIRALGGGPTQYSVAGGQPLVGVSQVDAAPFVQDDWRVMPNMTLSLGLRYELQNNINKKGAIAPRVGLAWGVGGGKGRNRNPKTVIRAGFGLFYDRIGIGNTLSALRQNGIVQQTYLVQFPNVNNLDFYPNNPTAAQLGVSALPQNLLQLYSGIQAPQILQTAIGVDRQLPRNITLSVNLTDSRGVHQLRERNINAPLPGSYNPLTGAAVYPLGHAGVLDQIESSGLYKQLQINTQINARVNNRINLFGYYVYGQAHSNTDSAGTFPVNNYDLTNEWSRAGFDQRSRIQLGGSIQAPLKISLSPNINYSTAPPLNITVGRDLNGDGIINDRPAFATVAANPSIGVIATPWGVFNTNPFTNPQYGSVIIPRNYATAYGQFRFNLRVGRSWGFGERVAGANAAAAAAAAQGGGPGGPGGGFGGGGGRGGRGGGGGGRGGGGGGRGGNNVSSNNKYTVNFSAEIQNLLNTVNTPAPVSNLSSPFLGQSLAGGNNAVANRRVSFSLRFQF